MKKKSIGLLFGIFVSALCITGCEKKNDAAEAANESIETEKEGNGEDTADKSEDLEEEEQEKIPAKKIGVLLPESNNEWNKQGLFIQNKLIDAGYTAQTFFAAGDAEKQIEQIQELTEEQAEALVIVPVDVYALSDVLLQAKKQSIPIISYQDLIMDTDAVSYYVTFDTRAMGKAIAEKIVQEKNLEKALENNETYNIEFAMGTPDDMDELFFFNGIMEVLKPYFENGTLISQSGQITFDEVAIMDSDLMSARERIENLVKEYYQETEKLDILCTASDEYLYEYIDALLEDGIVPGEEEWPLLTGVGCEADAVRKIAEGTIMQSVFMDKEVLAEECISVIETILKGETPEIENYEQYDNGVKIIGTFVNEGQMIDKDNYQILIDKGYYSAEEVEPKLTEAPVATVTPNPTEAPAVTVTPNPTEAPAVTAIPNPTEAPAVTVAPNLTETPTVTATPKPTNKSIVTVTPKPTEMSALTEKAEITITPELTSEAEKKSN